MNDAPTETSAGPRRKPRRGDVLELAVDALDARGDGVGTARGCSVHVRRALPGSRVRASVAKRRRDRVDARLVDVLAPSPHAVPARCPHTASCGGCSFQELAYEEQLGALHAIVRDRLAAADLLDGTDVEPVVGCAEPFGYRNKMDFTFGARRWIEPGEPEGVEADFALGLHARGAWHKVLDVRACALHFPEADGILATVRAHARGAGLAPWDVRTHEGLLRHLVLRKGVRTGEVMVDLVTSARAPESVDPLVEAVLAAHPEVTTVVLNVTTRKAAVAVGEEEHVLHGPGVVHEELCGLRFAISANSFFQTNTVQAERLFEIVREEAALTGDEVVHDLYCGAGTIGLALAGGARAVVGYESVASAVADARRNADLNGVEHATFVGGDVLETFGAEDGRPPPDVVVVDPPRAGLHPDVPPAVVARSPRRVVYVSCNVASAARDLPALLEGGYRLARARPVDLFPHTPHVECVFTLERAS